MAKQITKEDIMKKIMDKWFEDNNGLMEDISRLSAEINMFNIKWGTKLKPVDFIQEDPTHI